MVAVAVNLDVPIKIVVASWRPVIQTTRLTRALQPKNLFDASSGFSMLGLGDIVVPGIFISLALRFDYAQALSKAIKTKTDIPTTRDRYVKPYFLGCLALYVIGLAT